MIKTSRKEIIFRDAVNKKLVVKMKLFIVLRRVGKREIFFKKYKYFENIISIDAATTSCF